MGPYYDQYTLHTNFEPEKFDTSGGEDKVKPYLCCWKPAHLKTVGKKKEKYYRVCSVCGKLNHPGEECRGLFVTLRWYKNRRQYICGENMQVQHIYGQTAYLVIAGVFKKWTNMNDLLTVNMERPIVKAFNEDRAPPNALVNERVDSSVAAIDIGSDDRSLSTPRVQSVVNQSHEEPHHVLVRESEAARTRVNVEAVAVDMLSRSSKRRRAKKLRSSHKALPMTAVWREAHLL